MNSVKNLTTLVLVVVSFHLTGISFGFQYQLAAHLIQWRVIRFRVYQDDNINMTANLHELFITKQSGNLYYSIIQ